MTFPPDLPLLPAERAELLWADDLLPATVTTLERAVRRVDVAMFILAVNSSSRAGQRVRELLDVLLRAARRGVAVRLIVNDFRDDPGQPTLNLVAAHHLAHGGVGVRLYADEGHPSIHSKYLLVDGNIAVVGSGNWSAGGLGANLEAAVRVVSAPLVRVLRRRFDGDWAGAVELEPLP